MQQTASDPIPIRRPTITRGRFQSEIGEGSLRPKLRPSSFEEASTRFRARNESMGPGRNGRGSSGSPVPSASDLMMRTSSRYTDATDENAVRKTLIVKEDGKPSSRYQLGNCIGRGQFGSVYRALNVSTGQTVAVKRIPLEGLSDEEVTQLTNEVILLKSLSHYSIVKYEGMVRDDDTLNIVLEYVENGSLSHTIKAFGKLNERLVAGYVTKILEGLHYLHLSQVVHCDLKAANILTTKNGNVKLSDFGVSLNLRAMENIRRDNVAGTPNWMAPEVIELKGASTASDIWSLGCTIVELLTGRPPYGEIANSMSVMFHIVEDDMPPMPPGISDPLRDFLTRCFQKDPRKRPSAEILFEHEWLKADWGKYKELRPQDSIPFLRRVSADLAKTDMVRQLSLMGVDMSGQEYGALPSPFDERPQPVKRLSTGLSSPLLPGRAESPVPRAHSFVKTTFNKG
ncbi:kinase-like protein [Sistotremastrum niveocremeum HHB9708]|uniref:Kinase-like protein n=1 Tax=Sistotremastrum niveocremeum HHB9708 TaxID=1314777 RepID=A0A164VP51_9AGAM|nr:kinase-like protein [Sistotremastrum niveocremeum HHB9708]